MTPRPQWRLLAFGAAFLTCAAVITNFFLLPPTPDLMARATKIHDFGGPGKYDGFQWLDGHRLIATSVPSTPFPSVISINLDSKGIALLPHITHALKEVMAKFHSDELTDAIPSPDGKWILFCFSQELPPITCVSCAIRVNDGRAVVAPKPVWGNRIYWLTDSRIWVVIDEDALLLHSVNDPKSDRAFPVKGLSLDLLKEDAVSQINTILGKKCVFEPRLYKSGRTLEQDGVVSPDGKRIAWLYESAWPRGLPSKLRPVLTACGYRPHVHGEVWTTRIDGMDRHEIGAFNDHSPFPIDDWSFNWTPDGKALIFVRGGVLYSVPAR